MNSNSAEILAKWFLRFNGYFTVENFIVHAANDPSRISGGLIGNYTETDILAVRHQYSREIAGEVTIENYGGLVLDPDYKIDFLIVEVKTGNQNKPNRVWTEKNTHVIQYLLRFAGFLENEEMQAKVADGLAEDGCYKDPEKAFSAKLFLFGESPVNENWAHLSYIAFEEIINFIVDIRGQCWNEADLGVASVHYQWHPLITAIFKIANNAQLPNSAKKDAVRAILEE